MISYFLDVNIFSFSRVNKLRRAISKYLDLNIAYTLNNKY